MGSDDYRGRSPSQLTYYSDFLRILERQYAFASVAAVAEEIEFARTVGPALAGLINRGDGVFVARIPIGRGDFALVEMELDKRGMLQPVMGSIERKPNNGEQSQAD